MIHYLAKLLMMYATWRKRVYQIKDKAGSSSVYMIRYIVFKTPLLSLYIHRFLKSDEEVPHDHPFSFYSYVIKGGYNEYLYDKDNNFNLNISIRKEKSLAFRKAEQVHRVKLDKEYYLAEQNMAPLTVCLIFRRRREWGFWPEHTDYKIKGQKLTAVKKRHFVDWRQYLGLPANFKSEGQE